MTTEKTVLSPSEKELLEFIQRRKTTKGVNLSNAAFMVCCWLEGEGYLRRDGSDWAPTGKVAS